MARMGVFSRRDDTPDVVPRSLQLLSHRDTFDARYMEIYPNFAQVLYPNESISVNVTNFVRSIPMNRPQMTRVRVYQKFVAVPLRLMWSAWEDYIKGENDADFLYEEPYIVNATDGYVIPSDGSLHAYDNITFDGGRNIKSGNLISGDNPFEFIGNTDISRRGVVLDSNSYVPASLVAGSKVSTDSESVRQAYMSVGAHELGDYFSHPLYQATGEYDWADGRVAKETFSAFKFCAYQLAYSYFERSPNVQVRQDDYYEMAQSDCYDFPSVIACAEVTSSGISGIATDFQYNGDRFNRPAIYSLKSDKSGVQSVRDVSVGSSYDDKLRTTWEFCEKFPLKSGANLSMLASQPDPVSGLPRYVPSNISLTRKRFANWQTDYFTSCNPWPQRGDEAKIPVSGSVTVSIGDITAEFVPQGTVTTNLNFDNARVSVDSVESLDGTYTDAVVVASLEQEVPPNVPSIVGGASSTTFVPKTAKLTGDGIDSVTGITAGSTFVGTRQTLSFSGSSSASVSGLYVSPSNFRFAMTLQHIKEMQAQIDNRYQSYIRKFFGARARDYRLDRPEFLGGSVMELNVSDVTQTSQSTDDSVLGSLAGKSVSASTSRTIRYHADEHTVILGLIHIVPDTEYVGGLDRIDSTKDRFDWALPQFSHMSEQAVYNKELAYNSVSSISSLMNNFAFGYEPIYNNLRWAPNRACGAFRDTLNSLGTYEEYKPWISIRDFGISLSSSPARFVSQVPTLSDKFLSGRYNRDNSNFAITDDETVYPFMVDSYFNLRFTRIISTRGTVKKMG